MNIPLIFEWSIKIALWWTCISILTLPFVLALLKANGPDREPTPKPVLVWVNERKAEER